MVKYDHGVGLDSDSMFMERVGRAITRYPLIAIAMIVLITAGSLVAIFTKPMEEAFETEDFLPDMEVAKAWSDYEESFVSSYSFMVLIRSDDGDLIDKASFLEILSLSENLSANPTFERWKDEGSPTANPNDPVTSFYRLADSRAQADSLRSMGYWITELNSSGTDLNSKLHEMDSLAQDQENWDSEEMEGLLDELLVSVEDASTSAEPSQDIYPPDLGGPREYVSSFDDDASLKDEMGALLAYDIEDPEIQGGAGMSQVFLGSYPVWMRNITEVNETIDLMLSGEVELEPSLKEELNELKTDLSNLSEALEQDLELASGLGSLLRYGFIVQNFQTAQYSLNNLFTKDLSPGENRIEAKGCLLMVSLNHTLNDMGEEDEDRLMGIESNLTDVVEEQDGISSLSMHAMGWALISDEINQASNDSMTILLPLAALMVIIILSIIYRSVLDVLLNLMALGLAIIWMYGFGSLMGYSTNPMITAVPVLLIGLGIDYGIHLTMRYREEIKKGKKIRDSLEMMTSSVGMALLLATFTTVLAFLSNIFSPIGLIQQFGTMAAVGILSSFIIMVALITSTKKLTDTWKARKGWNLFGKIKEGHRPEAENGRSSGGGVKRLNKIIVGVTLTAERRPLLLLVLVLIITGGLGVAAVQNEVTFDINDFLPEDLEETKDIEYLMNEFKLGGSGDSGVIIVQGDITDPEVLKAMHQVISDAGDSGSDYIIMESEGNNSKPKVDFILYSMAEMAKNLGSLDPTDEFVVAYGNVFDLSTGLPKDSATSQDIQGVFDLFYEKFPSLSRTVLYKENGEYEKALISFTVKTDNDDDAWDLYDQLRDLDEPVEGMEGGKVESVRVSGSSILTAVIIDAITTSQVSSLLITMGVSLVVLTLVFYMEERAILLGAVATLPMVFCVIWVLGTMYLVGIPLNVMTITIGSLTVGLGITYGIHITHRFIEDIQCTDDLREATKRTIFNTGSALFGAAATTIAGFGLLVFALMPPLQQFGQVTALAILYSFLSSVIVLPALLVLWARGRQKMKDRRTRDESTC